MSKMNKQIVHWIDMSDGPEELGEYIADFLADADDAELEDFASAIAEKLMEDPDEDTPEHEVYK
ncbi:hypothetical protein [Mesorhizobium sp. L-8-3]|uniref:hypothetical protein n=1 Tax=Mesorhizobium sp. L-8-3 TaxID=2744522 RepID=UPI00192847B7|nr:hypothetical protein [Mesorhizobium sp. L-8-3]BCH25773.1 hypothetical protein MesoLjLb_55580 [Mesorhizobium sp. L-8-3]